MPELPVLVAHLDHHQRPDVHRCGLSFHYECQVVQPLRKTHAHLDRVSCHHEAVWRFRDPNGLLLGCVAGRTEWGSYRHKPSPMKASFPSPSWRLFNQLSPECVLGALFRGNTLSQRLGTCLQWWILGRVRSTDLPSGLLAHFVLEEYSRHGMTDDKSLNAFPFISFSSF